MKCSACKNGLKTNNFLDCFECQDKFHAECLNLRPEQFRALTPEYRTSWLCPTCSNVTKRQRSNVNTPVRKAQIPIVDDSMNMSYDSFQRTEIQSSSMTLAPSTPTNDNNIVTMEKISALLDQKLNCTLNEIMANFRKMLESDVKKIIKTEMDGKMQILKDDFTTTTNFICEEQLSLKRDVEDKALAIKNLEAENSRLQNELFSVNTRLSSMERMTRSQNLELQAVPESKNENPLALFKNLCNTLNIQLQPDQVHSCRRVAKINPDSNRPRNLLVTLSNPRLRDVILSAFQRYNKTNKTTPLNSSNLGLTSMCTRIYVVEHLSPECKALHAATRKAAKAKSYQFVWVKYGRVYVRKDESSGSVLIRNMDTLNKL